MRRDISRDATIAPCTARELGVASLFQALPVGTKRIVILGVDAHEAARVAPNPDYEIIFASGSVAQFEQVTATDMDAVLACEPGRDLPPWILFGHARAVLHREGQVLVGGYFAHGQSHEPGRAVQRLDDIDRHAIRAGFDRVRDSDNTKDTPVERRDLLGEETEEGQARWQVLIYRRSPVREGVFVREYRPGDEAKIHQLFRDVFDRDDSDIWHWKFRAGGRTPCAILAFRDDKLIAQYTGLPRRFLLRGEEIPSVQICDVMVDKTARGQWRADGPFAATVKMFFERYLGAGKRFQYAFGFPNERHQRLAEKLRLYEAVCRLWQLGTDDLKRQKTWRWEIVPVSDRARVLELASVLWQAMRDDFHNEALSVRDPAYIAWRYLDHPRHAYRFWVLRHRFTRQPVAMAVLSVEARQATIVDTIGRKADLPRLARMVASYGACCADIDRIMVRVTEYYRHLFEQAGYSGAATEIVLPTVLVEGVPQADELRDRLFLMYGDSDLV